LLLAGAPARAAALALRYGTKPTDIVGVFEFLSTKVGLVVVILGLMHFFNMRMLVRFRTSRLFKVFGAERAYEERGPLARQAAAEI
jgi:hypothetical protein